ncbi:hypothetical protein AB0M61_01825 [Streptomyces sp. NPDC051642]|uniref:hypothetical protein n=1 Tax=Streptomyces sp. NPDC051642 TaxID=3154646 RepID=UPI00342FDC1E
MTDIVQAPNAEEARARADRIRSGMRVLAEWQQDVIAAYAARDWDALGYETWDTYIDGEYGEHRVRLPREQRREIVAGMSAAGMSSRAIGSAVGSSHVTVQNDLQATGKNFPVEGERTVLSLDGRERPAARPAPEPNVWVEPGADEVVDAELVDEPARLEPPKPKRRPLPEAFTDAGRDLARAAERLTRLTEDDRFPKNRETTHHQVPELLGALDHTTRLVQAMNLPATAASEEARRWWATSLNTISDALRDVANSLEQEKQ